MGPSSVWHTVNIQISVGHVYTCVLYILSHRLFFFFMSFLIVGDKSLKCHSSLQ